MSKVLGPQRRFPWAVLACILVLATMSLTVLLGNSAPVSAQGAVHAKTVTPLPSPTNNGGSAQWTVNSMTFQSSYPKGFSFALDAASSGGKIVEATVSWSHAPGTIRHAGGTIDSSGKISATWVSNAAAAVPQWAGVLYWWILRDEAGNIYQTDQKYNEYADNTRGWRRMESEDIIVFWEESLPERIG